MGKVEINKERCKGCGYCIEACPKEVLGIGKDMNKKGVKPIIPVNANNCIGCSLCALMCPEACIEVWK